MLRFNCRARFYDGVSTASTQNGYLQYDASTELFTLFFQRNPIGNSNLTNYIPQHVFNFFNEYFNFLKFLAII